MRADRTLPLRSGRLVTWGVPVLYLVATLGVAAQRLVLHKHGTYLILRAAWFNLAAGVNLYSATAAHGLDYFRYSPSFALAFAPLAVLPVAVGLTAWYLLNAFALYLAVWRLLPAAQARLVLVLVLANVVRSLQGSQSNALVAALMIAAFLAYEADRPWRGAAAVVAGAAIKIFPAGAGIFALLRPGRPKRLVALALVAAVVLTAPALLLGPRLLVQQYRWWGAHEAGEVFKPMYSLMDFLDAWTGSYRPRWPTQLAGLAALLIPVVLRRDAWRSADFRRLLLCSLLVFSVLFNHGAEKPSFVIATTGIAIWWASGPRTRLPNVLMLLTLLLVTIGDTGLDPDWLHDEVIEPGRAAVIPLLATWLVMQAQLLRFPGRGEARAADVAAGQAAA